MALIVVNYMLVSHHHCVHQLYEAVTVSVLSALCLLFNELGLIVIQQLKVI